MFSHGVGRHDLEQSWGSASTVKAHIVMVGCVTFGGRLQYQPSGVEITVTQSGACAGAQRWWWLMQCAVLVVMVVVVVVRHCEAFVRSLLSTLVYETEQGSVWGGSFKI